MHEDYDDYGQGDGDAIYSKYNPKTFTSWIESVGESYYLPYNMNSGFVMANTMHKNYPYGNGVGFGYWCGR